MTPSSPTPDSTPPSPHFDERGLPIGYPFRPDWETTPRETAVLMRGEQGQIPVLLDCRRPEEWAFNRIAGAVHIPMNEIASRSDEVVEDDDRDRAIIVYCHHGRRSLQVAATLRGLGFANVKSMAGGIDLWSMDVDRAMPRY